MKTYRLSQRGQMMSVLVAIGTLLIWGLAVWKLPDVLGIRYTDLIGTLRVAIERGLQVSQIAVALLLIVMIVALPILVWDLLEERAASYTVRDDGLEYSTVRGVSMLYPWSSIKGLRLSDPEGRAPVYEVIVDRSGISQIRNPLLRWLHRQAYGHARIPIYAQVLHRDDLLGEIVRRAGLTLSDQPTSIDRAATK